MGNPFIKEESITPRLIEEHPVDVAALEEGPIEDGVIYDDIIEEDPIPVIELERNIRLLNVEDLRTLLTNLNLVPSTNGPHPSSIVTTPTASRSADSAREDGSSI